jgi:hypothetical protein
MSEVTPLHRLFALSWIDFCEDTGVEVEAEVDLSLKQQFLDLLLIRKGTGAISRPLPDGFEDLAVYNLVTFKSHQEALDVWALYELIGHYVNYRKQSSPSLQNPLPESDYRLFAVCARYPHNLAQQVELAKLQEGVYEVRLVTLRLRIIVVAQLRKAENNAMLHLFSAREDLLRYGQEHYRPYSQETSTLLFELFEVYSEESDMSDKLKEFARESIDKLLKRMPMEERLKGVPAEELLKRLPLEARLKGLSAEDLINALPAETLQELVRKLKANGSSSKPQ